MRPRNTRSTILCYSVNRHGIQPLREKTIVIQQYLQPKVASELRRFLGMIDFYRNPLLETSKLQQPYLAYHRVKTCTRFSCHDNQRYVRAVNQRWMGAAGFLGKENTSQCQQAGRTNLLWLNSQLGTDSTGCSKTTNITRNTKSGSSVHSNTRLINTNTKTNQEHHAEEYVSSNGKSWIQLILVL